MLSADVAKTIEAGSRYLETHDTPAQNAFRRFGWAAHEVQREMNDRPDQTAAEVATVATIDGKLSEMESPLRARPSSGRPRPHGRSAQASPAKRARRRSTTCSTTSSGSAGSKPQKVAAAQSDLASRNAAPLGLADRLDHASRCVLGILVVMFTVRHIGEPLDILVQHARRLSEGDLSSRAEGEMPGEFSILAAAMNQTGESLSRVVSVAARTAEDVSSSAHDLASVSEQISLSASQMATRDDGSVARRRRAGAAASRRSTRRCRRFAKPPTA